MVRARKKSALTERGARTPPFSTRSLLLLLPRIPRPQERASVTKRHVRARAVASALCWHAPRSRCPARHGGRFEYGTTFREPHPRAAAPLQHGDRGETFLLFYLTRSKRKPRASCERVFQYCRCDAQARGTVRRLSHVFTQQQHLNSCRCFCYSRCPREFPCFMTFILLHFCSPFIFYLIPGFFFSRIGLCVELFGGREMM